MKNKITQNQFLTKIALLLAAGFVLLGLIMWNYLRSSAQDIGYSLLTRNLDNTTILIAQYLGDPPSRIRALLLYRLYGIKIVYYREGNIEWTTGRAEGWQIPDHGMAGMIRKMLLREVYLNGKNNISIYFPRHLRKRYYSPQVLFVFVPLILIGVFIYLAVRKTLKPLNKIIQASERIGKGDLSYRIKYTRKNEFGKMALAFNTMAEKLGSMLEGQRELLHFISHELRTPLARINLALEMKDSKKSHSIIKQEVQDMDSLVEEILELSRMENQDTRERQMIDLSDTVKKITLQYPERNINLIINGQETMFRGNPIFINKAITNLIDNAVKYSSPEQSITVRIEEQNKYLLLSVKNTGPGIPSQELDKLWRPFYRGSNSGSVDGKGLGLLIVKKVVELSGGEVWVESSPEGPTTFYIKFLRNI